ncbi:uncharacterized protein PAC_19423 [Phialocephala subalpina]|uniref:Uncharacterized protein n=1 Tax=Phialocephala subalpina TaxID=576137 RepID=A0A1L7XWV3_9HELO|nr:uncharacterized protein PAC_19423 [Phialocephala subalpina]
MPSMLIIHPIDESRSSHSEEQWFQNVVESTSRNNRLRSTTNTPLEPPQASRTTRDLTSTRSPILNNCPIQPTQDLLPSHLPSNNISRPKPHHGDQPRMEQFLQALERVEAKSGSRGKQLSGPCLSTRMRDSWRTNRFWFNYGIRKSFDVDAVYWAVLHDGSAGVDSLDDEVRAEMESIKQMKMEQLKAYKEERASRFSKRGSE